MFNDEQSRSRTDANHAEILRQQAARQAASVRPPASPSPGQMRAQLARAGYRDGADRRSGRPGR